MKTSELTGAALDWAVAMCEGYPYSANWAAANSWAPSSEWAQAGAIIEREKIAIWVGVDGQWHSHRKDTSAHQAAETPLIAAMRCYVASKLGDEIKIPEID